jgi:hypothetical protein
LYSLPAQENLFENTFFAWALLGSGWLSRPGAVKNSGHTAISGLRLLLPRPERLDFNF